MPRPAALSRSSPIVCGVLMRMEWSGRMASASRWPRCWWIYCRATTEAISWWSRIPSTRWQVCRLEGLVISTG